MLDQIPHFYLEKSFEVCGILYDLYLLRKSDVHGQIFRLVRYSNVKDVEKLLKALNNVTFG